MVHSGRDIGDSDSILCEISVVLDQQDKNWILCFSFLAPPPFLPASISCCRNPLSSYRDKRRHNIHIKCSFYSLQAQNT